ncbi:hypothetical protein HELRODRAFT_103356 [Helobdella robusta]|uniref:RDD domain-containing protein n=1 Tax=Helobdella robusta TaxID=6412 RepID=T1EDF8_HELRO|nr:hypothetical protein HELRODRAFT_103356 [Helobdella robusta]ESN93627.1 hypothetical protein HELRODRAFT_103356 [Helobdella robusta]
MQRTNFKENGTATGTTIATDKTENEENSPAGEPGQRQPTVATSLTTTISQNEPTATTSNLQNDNSKNSNKCMTVHEYAEAYRTWTFHQQMVQQMNMAYINFYYMLSILGSHSAMLQNACWPTQASVSQGPTSSSSSLLRDGQTQQEPANNASRIPLNRVNTGDHSVGVGRMVGRRCEIASLWRRVLAELIDFFILFTLKLAGSIMFFDFIDVIDLDFYDLQKFATLNWDTKLANSITNELIMFELINRVFVSIFEALCLRRGPIGSVGGVTPGKKMMGIRVVSCLNVSRADHNKVLVFPAGNLNFLDALIRSLVKNFSFIFFIPMPLTVLMSAHSRTIYDLISNSMVVYVGPDDVAYFR